MSPPLRGLRSHLQSSAHPVLQPRLWSEFRYQLCPLLGPCVPWSRTRDNGGVPLKFCGQGRICTVLGIHESPHGCYLLLLLFIIIKYSTYFFLL